MEENAKYYRVHPIRRSEPGCVCLAGLSLGELNIEMTIPYHYTPYIWPMLASALLMAALGVYGWRRRTVPGALPFAFSMLFWSLMAVGAVLKLAAVDLAAKLFWYKFKVYWEAPGTVAALWFVLAYARLGRFLTRRNLILLSVFPCWSLC